MAEPDGRYIVTIGLDELLETLADAGAIEDQIEDIILDYAVQIQVLAQTYAPVKTGELRASIVVRKLVGGGAEISPDTVYEAYVEFGTGTYNELGGGSPYIIEPRNAQALRFMVAGKWVFAKRVVHPGIRAQPYMRPAADQLAEAMVVEVADTVVRQVAGADVSTEITSASSSYLPE